MSDRGVFLGIGSNLGDRLVNVTQAVIMIGELPRVVLEKESSIYKTLPYGVKDQPCFYNKVVRIDTSYTPRELLSEILKIESKMKRQRKKKWGPRIIDIDILFFNHSVVNEEDLVIPHYDIVNRDFCLYPMMELEPEFRHPVDGKTVVEMLASYLVTKKQDSGILDHS